MFVSPDVCLYAYFYFKSKSDVRITHFNKVICYTSIIFKLITGVILSEY